MEGTGRHCSSWLQSCCPGKVSASAAVLDILQWLCLVSSWVVNLLLPGELQIHTFPNMESAQSSKVGTHFDSLAWRENPKYKFQIWGFTTSWVKRV